jgi:hypothetical protein
MTDCLTSGYSQADLNRLGLGAAALKWQRLGFSVLALAPGTKRPHRLFASNGTETLAGVHWATTDPRMVEHVWSRDKLAGVGIRTNRLVVVDLDTHHGNHGEAELASFTDAWSLPLPPTFCQFTPSGGKHLWYRLPAGVQLPSRTSILPGVDIKAGGGYVAAAPTMIWQESMDGGRVLVPYRMHGCPCALAWLPGWMADWVLHAAGEPQGAGGPGGGDQDELPDLSQFQAHGLPRGERNVTAHRLACRLFRRFGVTPSGVAAVRGQLQHVFDATDMRGFSEHEVATMLESARRYIARQMDKEAEAWQDYQQTAK